MKIMYMYIGVAATIAVLVGGIILSSQNHTAASTGKVQYQQNGLNQNPVQNAHNSQNIGSNDAPSENGISDGDDG